MENYVCSQCGQLANPQEGGHEVDVHDAYFCDMCVTCFIQQHFVIKCGLCQVHRFQSSRCDCCQVDFCNSCNVMTFCLLCCDQLCPWCFVCKCELNPFF